MEKVTKELTRIWTLIKLQYKEQQKAYFLSK